MAFFGFSTGALALGDFRRALSMMRGKAGIEAVELSALREDELPPLVEALDSLDLGRFKYVSVHAPSRLQRVSERAVVDCLEPVFRRGWHVVLHPDVITDFAPWRAAGRLVCVENMDKRKPVGRDLAELSRIFDKLPDASFCFDIGHAHQIDPTMASSRQMLAALAPRLAQLHVSYVTPKSSHERLTPQAATHFRLVADLIPPRVSVVLETPVGEEEMTDEIARVKEALRPIKRPGKTAVA